MQTVVVQTALFSLLRRSHEQTNAEAFYLQLPVRMGKAVCSFLCSLPLPENRLWKLDGPSQPWL